MNLCVLRYKRNRGASFLMNRDFRFSPYPNDAGILKLYASDKSDNKQRKEYRRTCADNPDENPDRERKFFLDFFYFPRAAFRGFRLALQLR